MCRLRPRQTTLTLTELYFGNNDMTDVETGHWLLSLVLINHTATLKVTSRFAAHGDRNWWKSQSPDTGRFTGCGFKTLLLSAGKCHNLPLMALLRTIAACYVILFMGLNISLMVRLANVKAISLLIAILILTECFLWVEQPGWVCINSITSHHW